MGRKTFSAASDASSTGTTISGLEHDEDESVIKSDHLTESNNNIVDEDDMNTVLLDTEAEADMESCASQSVQDSDDHPSKKSKFDKSVDFVALTKEQHKLNLDRVLPDPRSIRRAHHQAASYLAGEVGSLMVKDGKTFLMPDGTSRAKVGKMGATLVSIEGKLRALKLQSMGNEKRENWADTIIHQIQRLAVASDESVGDIYRSICCLVSDSCKVNKGLAAVISAKLSL